MRTPRPDSAFYRFMLDTKYVRVFGNRVISRYPTRIDGGMRLMIRTEGGDDGILREIFQRKVYDHYCVPTSGQTVVDAGAHIGCYTLRAASLVGPEGEVLAFEPSSGNYALLRENLKLNKLKNVSAMNFGLGESESRTRLWVQHLRALNSTTRKEGGEGSRIIGEEQVRIRRLDDVLEEQGIERLDLLKLDAEGAELAILKGARSTLSRFRPQIMGEAHPGWSDPGVSILEYLKAFGYQGSVEPAKTSEVEYFCARAS